MYYAQYIIFHFEAKNVRLKNIRIYNIGWLKGSLSSIFFDKLLFYKL